jgi:hypothetical protein
MRLLRWLFGPVQVEDPDWEMLITYDDGREEIWRGSERRIQDAGAAIFDALATDDRHMPVMINDGFVVVDHICSVCWYEGD